MEKIRIRTHVFSVKEENKDINLDQNHLREILTNEGEAVISCTNRTQEKHFESSLSDFIPTPGTIADTVVYCLDFGLLNYRA